MAKKQKKKQLPPPSGQPDYTDPRQLESMIREQFRAAARREAKLAERMEPMMLDLDPARTRRRCAAIAETMPRVRELAGALCTLNPDIFSLEEEWAFVNTLPLSSYEDQNEECSLVTAAAIWMLDRIKAAGRLREALALLSAEEETEQTQMPCLFDPVHQEEVIRAMVCAISARNADCELPGQKRPRRRGRRDGESGRVFADMATALDVQRQDVPSRRRFEGLLALLPQSETEAAAARYEELLFAWTLLYFRCRAVYFPQEQAIDEEMTQLSTRTRERLELLLGGEAEPDPLRLPKPVPPLSPLPDRPLFGASGKLEQMMSDPVQMEAAFQEQSQRIERKMGEVKEQAAKLAVYSRRLSVMPSEVVERDFGAQIAALAASFRLEDPYEVCFAFLYLLDRGSALPWLYFPCGALNQIAGAMLPWYHGSYDELEDWHWRAYYEPTGMYAQPEVERPPELPDWHRLDYLSGGGSPEDRYRMNLAQVFYEATGCLMPRDLHRYDDALRLMRRCGVRGKALRRSLLLAMLAAGECRLQSHPLHSAALPPQPEPEPEPEPVPEDSGLKERLAALKQENERLKRSAYQSERAERKLRQELDALNQKSRMERQELSELRELLFHQENGTEPEQDEETAAITLPYEVRRTTVVFGGHESWARAIKPMLRGKIRFIDRTMVPEASLIRHAEMVWIQPNSLCHPFFYKIINNVRFYDIPLHYFRFASAEKCARQLAEADTGRS